MEATALTKLESGISLEAEEVELLISQATKLLTGSLAVAELHGPVVVVGDIHGSWADLKVS